jgi:hypothetical protein
MGLYQKYQNAFQCAGVFDVFCSVPEQVSQVPASPGAELTELAGYTLTIKPCKQAQRQPNPAR